MMTTVSSTNAGPPAQIYIIRHGEKPADPPTPAAAPSPPFRGRRFLPPGRVIGSI
jgi:hypothetical protein